MPFSFFKIKNSCIFDNALGLSGPNTIATRQSVLIMAPGTLTRAQRAELLYRIGGQGNSRLYIGLWGVKLSVLARPFQIYHFWKFSPPGGAQNCPKSVFLGIPGAQKIGQNDYNLVTRPPIKILRPLFTLQLLILLTWGPFHGPKSLNQEQKLRAFIF